MEFLVSMHKNGINGKEIARKTDVTVYAETERDARLYLGDENWEIDSMSVKPSPSQESKTK